MIDRDDRTPITTRSAGHRTLAGTLRVFIAEALLFPTGLITVAVLTRALGPEGYGRLTLAAMLIAWVEWTTSSVFTQATLKLVGERDDWRPLGSRILQLNLLAGVLSGAAVWLAAPLVARALGEPVLTPYLRLFAIDVPIFTLSRAHMAILTGIGRYNLRAWAIGAHWVARMALIVALVGFGLSIRGAILGAIGGTLISLVVASRYPRPSLVTRPREPVRVLFGYAAPLFLYSIFMRLFNKMDLFLLQGIGGSVAQAGFYGAAQNMALVPGTFPVAFSPLLLSTLSRLIGEQAHDHARAMARDALRLTVLLLPFTALAAGNAPTIVDFIFGPGFEPTAPLLAVLIFGAAAIAVVSVGTTILTAAGRPRLPFLFIAPIVVLAIGAHALAIPRWGALGAAGVTTLASFVAAGATMVAVWRTFNVTFAAATVVRSLFLAALAWIAATAWPSRGPGVVIELAALSALIPALLLLLGEFDARERRLALSLIMPRGDRSP